MTEDTWEAKGIEIRPLQPTDQAFLAALHARELSTEFIARLGPSFLCRYHRAFAASPYATALVAADKVTGRPVGVLFGTFENGAHSTHLLCRHGPAMTVLLLTRAVRDANLAGELLKRRGSRYARAILRLLTTGAHDPPGRGKIRRAGDVGVLAHVAVDREYRGQGIGASLVSAFGAEALKAGVNELELVTLPGWLGAGAFYETLGWRYAGERTSHSGERFSLYQMYPDAPGRGRV
jgi:GNAT superfamily N-acetyltransferase